MIAAHAERQEHESARDDFHAAANGAQGIDEKLPADAGDRGELAAHIGREGQPSHESS